MPIQEALVHRPALVARAATAAGLLALPLLVAAPASAQEAPAQVTVVHGVRGLVADVRLDGELVLRGFAPERVTDPLPVPAGTHRIQAWPTGADPASATPVVDQQVTVTAGQQLTAGIGLNSEGAPVVTVFDDAGLLPDGGSTALAARGLAKSAPVKVSAGDVVLADALAPTQATVQQVPAATYPVSVTPAAGGDPLVPAQDVPLVTGRAVVLYLIGSQDDGTLGWVAQTVRPTAGEAPFRVDTGVGPLPGSDPGPSPLLLLLPLAAGGAVLVRARRRSRVA